MGETVVPGVQNAAASTIMTIADMSLITAEVKVDETDIVNVKLDQPAAVTIDAMPNQTFNGHVVEIGNTAILRSTGLAASQSTTANQEAKDFKVVVALDNPPDDIRPGLSCSGKITTATRQRILTIPDPSSDHPPARRSGAGQQEWRRAGRRQHRSRRPKKPRRKKSKACLWFATAKRSSSRSPPGSPVPPISRCWADSSEGDEIVTGQLQSDPHAAELRQSQSR